VHACVCVCVCVNANVITFCTKCVVRPRIRLAARGVVAIVVISVVTVVGGVVYVSESRNEYNKCMLSELFICFTHETHMR
jgi:hypothetical protein